MITVAVDGMGGDNAPACMVQGAVDAVNKNSNIKVLLTGRPDELNKALEGLTYDKSRLEIVPARSEERRVGKECLRLCRSRWSPYH